MSGNCFVEVHTWPGSYRMDHPLFHGCSEREWIHLVSMMRLAEEGIRYVIQPFKSELVWCGATSFFSKLYALQNWNCILGSYCDQLSQQAVIIHFNQKCSCLWRERGCVFCSFGGCVQIHALVVIYSAGLCTIRTDCSVFCFIMTSTRQKWMTWGMKNSSFYCTQNFAWGKI